MLCAVCNIHFIGTVNMKQELFFSALTHFALFNTDAKLVLLAMSSLWWQYFGLFLKFVWFWDLIQKNICIIWNTSNEQLFSQPYTKFHNKLMWNLFFLRLTKVTRGIILSFQGISFASRQLRENSEQFYDVLLLLLNPHYSQ